MAVKDGWPDDALGGMYPFEDKWVRLDDGHTMHYIEAGRSGWRKPTFLLLHGNPTWSFTYREFIAPLAKVGRVVAPDHMGYGRSDHPGDPAYYTLERHIQNLEAFARKTRLDRVIPVMHDWGGPIGLGYAARHPDALAGLVLLNTWAFTEKEPMKLPLAYKALRARGLGDLLTVRRNLYVDRLLPGFTARGVPDSVLQAYRHPFPTPSSRTALAASARMVPDKPDHPEWATMDAIEKGLGGLDVPATILWATQKTAFPKRFAWAFHDALPNAEKPVWLEDAGHFLQEDAASRIVEHILDWNRRR